MADDVFVNNERFVISTNLDTNQWLRDSIQVSYATRASRGVYVREVEKGLDSSGQSGQPVSQSSVDFFMVAD